MAHGKRKGRKKRKQRIIPSPSDGGVSERGRFDYDVQDFVIEILSWLPVKSLLRFRCVCKSWRDLISNCYFINKQLSHAATTRLQIFKSSPSLPHELCQTSLKVANRKLDLPTLSEIYFVEFGYHPGRMITIVGSCNGLICLQLSMCSFLLWNPSTRVTKLSPRLIITSFSCHSCPWDLDHTFYGFGFDSSTQDYKVIVVKVSTPKIAVAVFALKTGSWKIVQGLEHANLTGKMGCFSNGALHWLDIKQGKQLFEASCSRILSFDLAREEFQEVVPLPNFFKENKHRISASDVGIGSTVKNSLFVYHKQRRRVDDDSHDNALTIWTMNMESGSWIQVVKIPHQKFPSANPIISILENEIVLMSYGSLVLYNPMKQKFFRCRHRTSQADLLQVTIYVRGDFSFTTKMRFLCSMFPYDTILTI